MPNLLFFGEQPGVGEKISDFLTFTTYTGESMCKQILI